MFRLIRFDSFATRRAIGALLLAHLFAVIVLAGVADLHKLAHPEADGAHHECAVTLYIKGGLEGGTTVALLVVCFGRVLCRVIRPSVIRLENLVLSRGVLGHAPPRA